ncbi:hypothetical protein [Flavobacterium piscisymbiosum]|uniref:Uncharacterized protein n=1 Tax=Flavobacterium piscisymbiosum TaxID=2893753 RepID=A0ABS8MDT9_9FLAO|nr:hypothetical protein [Flavobacterium sp. F-30]MCC9063675.1 hypothetical protein [Flavobacterium sp. F-30]
MGAAWIVENEHTIIFTPEFKASSSEFQSGALDPRERGFKINNHDRVIDFVENLRNLFPISTKTVFVSQKIREFIEKVNSFETPKLSLSLSQIVKKENSANPIITAKVEEKVIVEDSAKRIINTYSNNTQVDKLFKDLQEGRLKDEETILLHYAIDTARFKLGVGWKSAGEIDNIKTWEDVHSLNSKLSRGYDEVMRRLDLKRLTEVTEVTSSNNPREVAFISELKDLLIQLPEQFDLKINETLARNEKMVQNLSWNVSDNDSGLPF